MNVIYDELVHALMEERDREARQIAMTCMPQSKPRHALRRRLGGTFIRLGVWLGGAPIAALPR